MKLAPYIGITDFTSFEQVEHMWRVFQSNRPAASNRQLHVGVMMSNKTLRGIETKWSKVFPPNEEVARIFRAEQVYNCLHYADYRHFEGVGPDIAAAIKFGGPMLHAIQLDMIWPAPTDIVEALEVANRSDLEVILQINESAFQFAEQIDKFLLYLSLYHGAVQRVLFDKSMGRGLGMNVAELMPYVRATKEKFPDLGISVAGGLGPDSLDLVLPIIREFPDVSIDAQSKLRPSGDIMDPVDWDLAATYLVRSLKMFGD